MYGLNKDKVDISSNIVEVKAKNKAGLQHLISRRDSLPRRQKRNKADTCPTIFVLETRLEFGVGS